MPTTSSKSALYTACWEKGIHVTLKHKHSRHGMICWDMLYMSKKNVHHSEDRRLSWPGQHRWSLADKSTGADGWCSWRGWPESGISWPAQDSACLLAGGTWSWTCWSPSCTGHHWQSWLSSEPAWSEGRLARSEHQCGGRPAYGIPLCTCTDDISRKCFMLQLEHLSHCIQYQCVNHINRYMVQYESLTSLMISLEALADLTEIASAGRK